MLARLAGCWQAPSLVIKQRIDEMRDELTCEKKLGFIDAAMPADLLRH
jgi:hypothetical protein